MTASASPKAWQRLPGRILRVAAPCCLAAAMGACTVGPSFKVPKLQSPLGYLGAEKVNTGAAPEGDAGQMVCLVARPPARWWTLFKSAELDSLVDQATTQNFDLLASRARTEAARERLAVENGGLYPELGVAGDAARQRINLENYGLGGNHATFNLYSMRGLFRYPLDLFGGTRRRIEEVSARASAEAQAAEALRLNLAANVIDRAVSAANLRSEVSLAGDIVEIDRRVVALTKRMQVAGRSSTQDVMAADNQLAEDMKLLANRRQEISETLHALAILLGKAPAEWNASDLDLDAIALPAQVPVSMPSALVRTRPDILQAEAELHAATAAIGVATARLYPNIAITGSFGTQSNDRGRFFSGDSSIWRAGLELIAPLFNGGALRAERRATIAESKAALADYQAVILHAFGEIGDLLQALSNNATVAEASRRQHTIESTKLQLADAQYSAGSIGAIELLKQKRRSHLATMEYRRAEARRYSDTAALLAATGGNWPGAADHKNEGSCAK